MEFFSKFLTDGFFWALTAVTALFTWLGKRMVKRIDAIEKVQGDHATRLAVGSEKITNIEKLIERVDENVQRLLDRERER